VFERVDALRIGVVSDTHVPDRQAQIPEAVLMGLQGVDLIIHAGDLTDIRVLDTLETIATVQAVSGNVDSWPVKSSLQPTLTLRLEGKILSVFHGATSHSATEEYARTMFPGADCVVFGHTHRSLNVREGKTLLFNPGTASRIFGGRPSYGVLTLKEGQPIEGEIFEV